MTVMGKFFMPILPRWVVPRVIGSVFLKRDADLYWKICSKVKQGNDHLGKLGKPFTGEARKEVECDSAKHPLGISDSASLFLWPSSLGAMQTPELVQVHVVQKQRMKAWRNGGSSGRSKLS